MNQLAILDYEKGSIELHTLPQHVTNGTEQDFQDYLHLTLGYNESTSYYMTGNTITVHDFRTKTPV